MPRIDAIASQSHFVDHMLPVWLALPDELRGTFYLSIDGRDDVPNASRARPPSGSVPTLVASSGDLHTSARKLGRPSAIMEHGCGQSFGAIGDESTNARRSRTHSSYAGGMNRPAGLFLHPGPHPAARDRATYPAARVEIVGCAKLDSLPRKPERSADPVVAVAFHWPAPICPETKPAATDFKAGLRDLVKRYRVIGHGHPRFLLNPYRQGQLGALARWYEAMGIEVEPSFEGVCRRADVYLNDCSSTLFEFASTGRPVVVLNSPQYRRNVSHGLRFWEAATVGVQVTPRDCLADAVARALADPPEQQEAREAALDLVYAYRSGGGERAAAALVDWVS